MKRFYFEFYTHGIFATSEAFEYINIDVAIMRALDMLEKDDDHFFNKISIHRLVDGVKGKDCLSIEMEGTVKNM